MESDPVTLKKFCADCKTKWFEKGRESVLRKNESGCCCEFSEADEITHLCLAHAEYFKRKLFLFRQFNWKTFKYPKYKPYRPYCAKCGGEGWVWWHELDDYYGPGNDPHDCNTDDNRYSCDWCSR